MEKTVEFLSIEYFAVAANTLASLFKPRGDVAARFGVALTVVVPLRRHRTVVGVNAGTTNGFLSPMRS